MQKNVSVILTGSVSSGNLEKVLLGYNAQNYRNFEVLLALKVTDTTDFRLPESLLKELFFPVLIVQVADGFMNSEVSFKATTDYLLFAALTAIPRYDFVEQHVKYREEGYFLSGSSNVVTDETVQHITRDTLNSGICFTPKWLKKHSRNADVLDVFRFSEGLQGALLNRIFCGNTTFNFVNASVWKKDVEGIFETPTTAEEITRKLTQLGCKPKQIKYSTVLLEQKS